MNIYNAARAAGYSEAYAKNSKPERVVKEGLANAFERAGFTDKFIVEYINEALDATKAPTENSPEWADWQARHKFLETALKLTERLKDKVELSGTVNIELADAVKQARERLQNYASISTQNEN